MHIITVEEPIEYVHRNKKSLIIQRQVRKHVDKFSTALKAALREDPDVIMVGEMRDLETISMAITAAETGHLVFATLHTNGAIQTVNRIIDAFPQEQQSQIRTMFSESLRGIVSQQLIPRLDGQGRAVAYEVLHSNPSVANLIRDNKIYQIFSTMQMGRAKGMFLMDDSLMDLVKQGLIKSQDALERATDAKTMQEFLAKSGRL
jgi:twitching motility protein PilT